MKKDKNDVDVESSVVGLSETDIQIGTPTMVLLPARNYCFRVSEKEHTITIPRYGKYKDIDSNFFNEEDGEFNLYDGRSKLMYLPAITKVLFATKKYPSLESNQLFAPLVLRFKKDEVSIIGQIVEMIEPCSSTEGSLNINDVKGI